MPKKKPAATRRDAAPSPVPPATDAAVAGGQGFVAFRETIESIVVAFVLAFLFRTFEAEAFVIPTGSMSPSLQGRHKDVECLVCGHRIRTSASSEDPEELARRTQFANFYDAEVVGGMCPMCRFPMPYTTDLPPTAKQEVSAITNFDAIELKKGYPGDRILVDKYGYDFSEPERWDVVVFKFPGNGEMNYIKRLVGLPGETLQLFQGDVFTRPLGSDEPFRIVRKPADKVAAMLQLVHDTDYEAASMYKAGWPLRWDATTKDGWQTQATAGEQTVDVNYTADLAPAAPLAWLRYRHQIPNQLEQWIAMTAINRTGSLKELADQNRIPEVDAQADYQASIRPELITDFNSYNTRIHREYLLDGGRRGRHPWMDALRMHLGWNWVSDLAVEAAVEVVEDRGELVFDLVEAGFHFRATIDVKSGDAALAILDGRTGEALPFEAKAKSPLVGAGEYQVRFANVDDQLLLWVNGEQVEFAEFAYDPDQLFASAGGRRGMLPWVDANEGGDQGDLAPAGVGARGAHVAVSRLKLYRDVYYIAATEQMAGTYAAEMDFDNLRTNLRANLPAGEPLGDMHEVFARPDAWSHFATRRDVEFDVKPGQLFVMGDNSPESADCRLWESNSVLMGIPGGSYLDRRLVIGKAVSVFWPHSWGEIPGAPWLPGLPNFGDMRLVR